jgi:uncharacterized Zn finger protein (UPF0148 family)
MISFECPSCNAKLQVKDEHAGKTIQCPTCKTKVAAPAADEDAGAIQSAPSAKSSPPPTSVTTPENTRSKKSIRAADDDEDDDDDDLPKRKRDGGSDAKTAAAGAGIGIGMILAIVGVLSVCCLVGVAGILVALLVPAVSKVREAAGRTESINNLKQIGIAMHGFHDTHKRLPFNGSDESPKNAPQLKYSKAAKPGDPLSGSWAFQITPFVEQQGVFNQVNRTAPIKTYLCPGRGRPPIESTNGGGAWTDYFYNNYLNDPMQANRPDAPDQRRTLMQINDGTSNTILVGHGNVQIKEYKSNGNVLHSTNIFGGGGSGTMRSGNPGKTTPGGVMLARDSENPPGPNSWGGPFPSGTLMAFCDGTVRSIPYSYTNLNAILTPDGGEAVPIP